jgi:hypothetical protein
VLRRAFRPGASQLEDRTLLSTTPITWANDVSGDWDNPAMWTGGAVPGPGNDAVISFSDITVTHNTSASDIVNSVTCAGSLDITNGSLALSATSSVAGSLTLQGATLSTAGTLTVTGSMTWTAGTISGSGVLNIASGAVLNLNEPTNNATETLVGAVLENAGTANVLGTNNLNSGLSLQSGAGVQNQAGASFNFQVNASIFSDGSATYYSNAGSLTQVAGANSFFGGGTVIAPAFTQTASGTTSVQGGGMTFPGGGTVSGSVSGAAGTVIQFIGSSFSFGSASTITSAGGVAFDFGAVATVSGAYDVTGRTYAARGSRVSFTAPIMALGSDLYLSNAQMNLTGQSFSLTTLEVYGSTLNGAGGASLTVTGAMTWVGGTVSGFGTLNIPTGATLNLGNGNSETLEGVALENAGTGVWSSGTFVVTDGGEFNNMPGTVFGSAGNTGSLALNNGALAGSGTINATVTNAGQVIPGGAGAAGILTINGNYTQTATGALDGDLGGVAAGSQYDQLVVSGTASLGGTMELSLINSFRPAFGNSFQVLTFGSSSGNFATYTGTSLASGLLLDPVFNASSLTLDIDQVAITGAPALPLPGLPINLAALVTGPSSGNSFTYTWNVTQSGNPFGSGLGSSFTFTPNLNATYVVTLTVSDVIGDKGTASLQLIVAPSIVVLDPSAGGALALSGNAGINTAGSVYVDSSSSNALSASGNAQVRASLISVHGKVQKTGNSSFNPAPVTGATVFADPFAGLAVPVASTLGLNSQDPLSLCGNASQMIGPGVYSKISVSGNASLTLNPGVYIITGGGLTVSGNASISVSGPSNSITGVGVMIYNAGSGYNSTTGADGGSMGAITLSGSGTIKLVPPSTGTYAGMLVFQARDNAKTLTFSGNAMQGISGMIYAPAAQLAESGNAQIGSTSNPVSIVVDTLSASGNAIADGLTLTAPGGTAAYTPAQIRAAYGISALALDGTGQTTAIVDAYDDPNIFQSVDTFDSQFGLTVTGPALYAQYGPASSFLTVLNQEGQPTSLPSTDPNGAGTDNWEVEEALDVEWVHAIAPGAQIILVEANSQSLSDLMASAATGASQPGVSVVSMSWGFAEGQAVFASDEATFDSTFNVPGVTFIASTGDYGASDPQYPAFSPNVVAVGGTSLTLNADSSYSSETGWGYYSSAAGASIGSGGGISLYEPEPAYQQNVQSLGMRTTPDVSLVADPATGAWIADTYNLDPSNPFEVVGGTSLSAPAWAGLLALVNQGRASAGEPALNSASPTEVQQALYRLPQSDYNVITSGSNGYSAAAGYNLVTGLGTPAANLLVPDLVAYQGAGTSYNGATVGPLQNANLNAGWSGGGGATDVFSVFDSIRVTATVPGRAAMQGSVQTTSVSQQTGRQMRDGDHVGVGQPFEADPPRRIRLESPTYGDVRLESLAYSPVAIAPLGDTTTVAARDGTSVDRAIPNAAWAKPVALTSRLASRPLVRVESLAAALRPARSVLQASLVDRALAETDGLGSLLKFEERSGRVRVAGHA